MPAEDHPVHPLTVGSERYDACQKSVRAPGYWAPDTRYSLLPPKHVWHWVEDVMSRDCRYDNSLADPKCAGCKERGAGERYAAEVKARSAACS